MNKTHFQALIMTYCTSLVGRHGWLFEFTLLFKRIDFLAYVCLCVYIYILAEKIKKILPKKNKKRRKKKKADSFTLTFK